MNTTIYNLIIKIVSAVCSSGKTYALIYHTKESQNLSNNLFVLPSIDLVNQIYDDLKELGTEKAVKAAGKARLEGKEYLVQDGDIINFRFNV